MLKSEFDALLGKESPNNDYQLIEYVYNYHPCNFSKEATASLYKEFGLLIFKDMENTAKIAQEIDEEINHHRQAIEVLKRKYEELRE